MEFGGVEERRKRNLKQRHLDEDTKRPPPEAIVYTYIYVCVCEYYPKSCNLIVQVEYLYIQYVQLL